MCLFVSGYVFYHPEEVNVDSLVSVETTVVQSIADIQKAAESISPIVRDVCNYILILFEIYMYICIYVCVYYEFNIHALEIHVYLLISKRYIAT